MKKRLLALGLCVMMVLSLAGCNKKEEVVTQPSETQETESTETTDGKAAILAVSFGTSYNDNRDLSIGA